MAALDISIPFVFPEFFVCFRYDTAVFTAVHMPEATVNKYYLPVPDQDNIRAAGQFSDMQSVTITK
jgi:hypothetical protein